MNNGIITNEGITNIKEPRKIPPKTRERPGVDKES